MNLASIRTEDVAIGRLTIKAPAGEADLVTRDLTLAAWPRAEGRSWVFIRRVHAEAPRSQLGRAVSAAARRILDGDADDGLVMRFASLEELLARLLADLAAGCASRRWYWRRWANLFSLPVGRALAEVMADSVNYLPAVIGELDRMKTLPDVWSRLDRQGALGLMEVVARRNGVDRMSGLAADPAVETMAEKVTLPQFIRTRWTAIFETLEIEDPRHDLALMLIGQEVFPLMLLRRPMSLFQQLNQALGQPVSSDAIRPQEDVPRVAAAESIALPQPDRPPDRGPAVPGIRAIEPVPTRKVTSESTVAAVHDPTLLDTGRTNGNAFPAADAVDWQFRQEQAKEAHQKGATQQGEAIRASAAEARISTGQKAASEPTPALTVRSPGTPMGSTRPGVSQRLRPDHSSAAPSLNRFVTTQGGLFFLLNFLKREDVQLQMKQGAPAETWASGWGWLYRLGKELALDESDSVVEFMALQMGLDSTEELAGLPPLPARERLLNLARQLYGRYGLWQPELLRLDARVHYTPSHVDLYASLQNVRMPVRLAGLDLDPGWLPWLGRVVTFTYE